MFFHWNEHKLKLGEYQMQSYVYGSTGQRRDDEDYEEHWIQMMIDAQNDKAAEKPKMLTKAERKAMIKERNELMRKVGSKQPAYSYKELCSCGSWIGDGQLHRRHCPKWKKFDVTGDVKCGDCGTTDDAHWSWCPTFEDDIVEVESTKKDLVGVTDHSGRPVLRGIFVNTKWVCPSCYNEPRVDDQECPHGHGRVVGNVEGQK